MKRCKHTTSTARSAFLRSSVLLPPLLFSSFPLLFSPLLLLYSRLGEETRPNDERTSLKLVSHKLRARKLVSEIRHFSQPLPPPLHSSLEHTGTLLRPYFSMGTYTSCTPPPCHGPLFSLSCYKPEENRKDRPLPRQKVDHEKSSYRANQEYPPYQLFFFLSSSCFSSSSISFLRMIFFGTSPWHLHQGTFHPYVYMLPTRFHPYALRPSYRDFPRPYTLLLLAGSSSPTIRIIFRRKERRDDPAKKQPEMERERVRKFIEGE